MFRRRPNPSVIHDYETSVAAHQANVSHIKRSFEALNLDRDRATLVGGAALRLHGGIRRKNAADLDIVVPAADLTRFHEQGLDSPHVLDISLGHQADADIGRGTTSLRVVTSDSFLDADLISRYDPAEESVEAYDARFDETVDFEIIDGIRVASLLYLLDEYSQRKDAKATHDKSVAADLLRMQDVDPKKALRAYHRTRRR